MNTDEEQFGTLVLVIGDMHVPDRVSEISQKIKQMLPSNKFSCIISTGNFGSSQAYDWVKSVCNNLVTVKGDFEDASVQGLSDQRIVDIKNTKIGVIHGHQIIPCGVDEALFVKATEMNVPILISGHTHQLKISQLNGVTFINPGSLTGAYSPLRSDVASSFVILEIKKSTTIVYGYQYVDGELRAGKYIIQPYSQ